MKQAVREISHDDLLAKMDYIIHSLKEMHEEFLLAHNSCNHSKQELE